MRHCRGVSSRRLPSDAGAAALGGAYFYGKERGRKEAGALLKAGSATAEMVERTERALDALAIEVERVGEAQRHAAKMLAKQADKEPQARWDGFLEACSRTA